MFVVLQGGRKAECSGYLGPWQVMVEHDAQPCMTHRVSIEITEWPRALHVQVAAAGSP
jgi:hypothetical protein